MTIGQIFKLYKHLDQIAIITLLEKVTNKKRVYLLAHEEELINNKQLRIFQNDLKKLKSDTPLAYLIGYKEFFGLSFKVNSNTLIPRPETELLVEKALEEISASTRNLLNILEIGTGCGCIPISLLQTIYEKSTNKSKKLVKILSTDISRKSLSIAKQNAQNLLSKEILRNLSIQEMNVLNSHIDTKFDLLISNPPYIPTYEWSKLNSNIKKYEPRMALDGGKDGLDAYRKIFTKTKKNLTKKAKYILEIHAYKTKDIITLTKEYYPESEIQIIKDYGGKDRIAIISNLI